MGLKKIWSGGVSIKAVLLVALVSLAVGLGISGSLDWLVPSRAVDAGKPELRPFTGLPGASDVSSRCLRQDGAPRD